MSISEQLKALAKGINPETGESLDSNSCANRPEAIRLLFTLADELTDHGFRKRKSEKPKMTVEERQAKNLELGRPKNSHLPWTDEGKHELVTAYNDNDDLRFLAEKFERSVLAIAVQLGDAELLTEEEVEFYRVEQSSAD
jgi:hypothetical protein